jgi:hypothetical protein
MEDLEVRPVRETDASELATLLNEIISRGGTTALEEPFAPDALARTLLIGPDIICCFVAVQRATSQLMGFQSLERSQGLPDDIGDIGTFVRVGLTQRGVGSASSRPRAPKPKGGSSKQSTLLFAPTTSGVSPSTIVRVSYITASSARCRSRTALLQTGSASSTS